MSLSQPEHHSSYYWRHDPPCLEGGFTEVSPYVMHSECCPLCGARLTPPPEVAEVLRRREERDAQLAAAWKPRPPREIIALGQAAREKRRSK